MRIAGDAPGPGQEMAIRIIELAQRVIDQGNSITVRWTPAHREVEGNERAGQAAKDAASLPPLRATRLHFSLAYLKRRATKRATQKWRRDRGEKRRTKELSVTHGYVKTRHTPPPEESPQGHRGKTLPVAKRPRNDSPLLKGEMGVDRHRRLLVGWQRETEQGESL